VTEAWLKKNPDTARGVARGIVRALQLIHSDPEAVRADLKNTYPQFDDPFLDQMVKEVQAKLSKDGKLDEVSWQSVNDIIVSYDPTVKPVPYADAAALEYLPTAK
jgi:ABC-type nitrate/sulfonate/bicarbonate transport system substrate-binding protein